METGLGAGKPAGGRARGIHQGDGQRSHCRLMSKPKRPAEHPAGGGWVLVVERLNREPGGIATLG